MSAAQELRDAAGRLRTLAEAATPGPWEADGDRVWADDGDVLVMLSPSDVGDTDPDVPLVAAMHPGVALALARWLESYAISIEAGARRTFLTRATDIAALINGSAS